VALDLSKISLLMKNWELFLKEPAPPPIPVLDVVAGADITLDMDFADFGALLRRLELAYPFGNKRKDAQLHASATEMLQLFLDSVLARTAGGDLVGRDGLAVLVNLPPYGLPSSAGKWADYFPPTLPDYLRHDAEIAERALPEAERQTAMAQKRIRTARDSLRAGRAPAVGR
jgi:hypothetical protein